MRNKILLNSGALYNYGLNRFFELAKKADFDGIELIIDNNWDNRQPEYIGKLERENKIKVLAVHSAMEFVYCWGPDPKIRIAQSIKIAKKLGAKLIVVHPADYNDRGFYKWLRKNYQVIIDKAVPMRVAFENMTTRRKISNEKFFKLFPSYALDTSHIGTHRQDPVEMLEAIRGKLTHIHLSDSDFKKRENRVELIADCHMMPGTGKLPLKKFLKKLKEIKYDGFITVELLPESVDAGKSDAEVVRNLKKALNFVRNNLK